MKSPLECDPELIEGVLDAATEVHRELGPGLLESAYERALAHEMQLRSINFERQLRVPLEYKGKDLGAGFRADFVVEGSLLLELKATSEVAPVHIAQVINYLKLLNIKRGFLMNFSLPLLKQGLKRISI